MFKKCVVVVAVFSLFTVVLAGCGGNPDNYIEVRGSDTMVNLGQHYAEAFMEKNPQISISVTGGGSGTGIAALINNTVDIAQSSRAITPSELEDARKQGVEVYEFIVGQDGLSVMVNAENPITQVTVAQLKKIFTGAITHWAELGWEEGGTISLYSRQSNSGTYVFFWQNIMDSEDWADDTKFMPGSSAIYEAVAAEKNAIGYAGVAFVKEGVHALKVATSAAGPFVDPQIRANIDDGSYPIARPLFFYTNGVPEGAVLEYLKWVLSEEGYKVLAEAGFYRPTPEQQEKNSETFKKLGIK